jgi:uncharacterized damage-inducible protein DinB
MAITEALLPEFDQEMKTTRKMLERVPENELNWKPHEKSMTLGRLASHLVDLLSNSHLVLDADVFDAAGRGPERSEHKTVADLLAGFDRNVTATREKIASKSDAEMLQLWNFVRGDQTLMSKPRAAMLRTSLLNHMIHHRGQLSVYLRLKDVPVPGAYGPSADEKGKG